MVVAERNDGVQSNIINKSLLVFSKVSDLKQTDEKKSFKPKKN